MRRLPKPPSVIEFCYVDDEGMGDLTLPDEIPEVETIPAIRSNLKLPTILGNGALIKFASDGGDVDKVFDFFSGEVRNSPGDAGSLLDLALLHLIKQRKSEAYRVQARALELQQVFRVVGTNGSEVPTRRRVLAVVAPGDFMNNAQLEFLLDGSDTGLDVLYLVPGKPLPSFLPEHDVLFCAVNESDENAPILQRLAELLPAWPRPVLNPPRQIARLTRDGTSSFFKNSQSICAPAVRRITASGLRRLAAGEINHPLVVRPVGSHCGRNFEKITDPDDLKKYLTGLDGKEHEFYLAPFADYRGNDGLYRKYRVVLIDGAPYLCHMAACEDWKIHYVNAGMAESVAKRDEEARAMETFDVDFARRHASAFKELVERIGLDYFGVDCAGLPDGRLLLFEAETAMVIHAMDSPALYPYKPAQMAKVFSAFRALVDRASRRAPGLLE
jgi:glutathione synthase/RimK-type ligase-like ATP-grasp enzyme